MSVASRHPRAAVLDDAFALVRAQVDGGLVPAAVLGVADAEGIIRCEGFGTVDGRPLTGQDRFLIASITKPILASAVMQLVEAGRLALDEPVQRIVPEFSPPPAQAGGPGGEAVTPWHLLTHTSGVGDIDTGLVVRTLPDRAELLRRACTAPLAFTPGGRYAYASDSFYVLGELIRRIDGRDYPAYLSERILVPLGMGDTSFDPFVPADRRVAVQLPGFPGDAPDIAVIYSASLEAAGWGLWSSCLDVLRFGRAMLAGGSLDGQRVLAPGTVELMTREHTQGIVDIDDPSTSPRYGLGWVKPGPEQGLPGSPRAFGHGGATGTRLWVDPAVGLVVVYLMNVWDTSDAHSAAAVRAVVDALG
jgi:CubicO group peptidase (beta-lactamase class C family)